MQVESDIKTESTTLKEEAKAEDSVVQKEVVVTGSKTAQILVEEDDAPSASDFHINDSKVLSLLNETGSNYSFKGLMRKLNLHQQSQALAKHPLTRPKQLSRRKSQPNREPTLCLRFRIGPLHGCAFGPHGRTNNEIGSDIKSEVGE